MRIALISDIHEDVLSLQKAFRKIEKSKVDSIVCLGDISGFTIPKFTYFATRNAHECLQLVQKNCSTVVLGNHDMFAAKIIPKEKYYFDFPENWYQLDYRERKQMARGKIWFHEEHDMDPLYSKSDTAYLQSLPHSATMKTELGNCLFSHYIHPNPSGFKTEFYNQLPQFKEQFSYLEKQNCNFSFVGHSHIKGFYLVTPDQLKHHGYTTKAITSSTAVIGVPPITSHGNMSGFCIFDTFAKTVQSIRL